MTPQQSKNIKTGLTITGIAVFLYLVLKPNDNGGETEDPTGNNSNPGSIDSFDANKVRLALFYAMNRLGTDETKIIQTLSHVTPAQFDQVITAFGKERYNDFFGYKTAGATERDLLYWMNAEMKDSSEYTNLQRKFNRLY